MKPLKRALALVALLVSVFAFTLNGFTSERMLRVEDRKVVGFDGMLQEAGAADIIVVGETHSNPRDHALQLRIIRALHEKGVPVAIGLEMFSSTSQRVLNEWVGGTQRLEQFLPVYYQNWNLPWPLYQDIFLYARKHGIPLVGLNVPRSITAKVAKEGFDSLTEGELRELPAGISCSIDDAYREFIMRAHSAHSHGKDFKNFCEAQMVWDNAMALNALAFLDKNPRYTLVLLAGTVHAWKPAVPEQLRRQKGNRSISVVLPEVPGKADTGNVTVKDADFLLLN